MSSVDDEPRAIAGILEGCLNPVLNTNGRNREDVQLGSFNEEGFFRQSNRIPTLLAPLVEEKSKGAYTVRPASSAIADNGTVFNGESYFVRCASDTPEGEVTHPTADMVLFVINGHTKRLFVNVPMQSQDRIDAEIVRREEARIAYSEAEDAKAEEAHIRREAIKAEHEQLVAAIDWHVQESGNKEASLKWLRMNSGRPYHSNGVGLVDLLDLCHILGISLAMLVITAPASAEATH